MPDVKDLPTAKLAYPRAATVMLSIRGRMGYPTRPNASAMSVEQVARVGWPESSLAQSSVDASGSAPAVSAIRSARDRR
jgi:hypothetical protein